MAKRKKQRGVRTFGVVAGNPVSLTFEIDYPKLADFLAKKLSRNVTGKTSLLKGIVKARRLTTL